MSDQPLSDIDFKNKMAWVGTTLKFSKKSPKPFLRPNTWSCSAPFDRNNLKSWLLIYVHLKVTFQFQEISPKFDFFFKFYATKKSQAQPESSTCMKIRLLKNRFDKSRVFLNFSSRNFRQKTTLPKFLSNFSSQNSKKKSFSGSKKNKNR